jgi:hypothetical protein
MVELLASENGGITDVNRGRKDTGRVGGSLRRIGFHKTSDTETDLILDSEIMDKLLWCDTLSTQKRGEGFSV